MIKCLTPDIKVIHLPNNGVAFVSAFESAGRKWVDTNVTTGNIDGAVGIRFALSPSKAAELAAGLLAAAKAAGWREADG